MSLRPVHTSSTDREAKQARRFGNLAPPVSDNGRRTPDKRRVSLRWFTGSILTGLTSALLMGGALYAAFDGRQQMALPANLLDKLTSRSVGGKQATKGDRVISIVALEPTREKIILVPTVTRVGETNVIRKKPFAYAAAPLAIVPTRKVSYAAFNPLTIYSTSRKDRQTASSDVIYSANVEGEVTIKTVALDLQTNSFSKVAEISDFEAQLSVAKSYETLAEGDILLTALPYLDPTRFALNQGDVVPASSLGITITAENVSHIAASNDSDETKRSFEEEAIVISRAQSLLGALQSLNAEKTGTLSLATALGSLVDSKDVQPGTKLRVSWERQTEKKSIELRRAGMYRDGKHIGSVAFTEDGTVVTAREPAAIPATAAVEKSDAARATVSRANLPNVYDGIHRAALSQGLNKAQAKRIVRTVAFDVDFRSTIGPKDELEVFYSIEEGKEEATDKSEILFIGLTLKGKQRRYYRFRVGSDRTVDYYDENGKSAKKFLLRKPVPNGKFRSPFGMRRHPISRRYKLHAGVDFSAPRGTPILASGNGIIEKAGWLGGCGKGTVIRHANGYKTRYCHQHRISRGIKPGVRVRQGQIIGQVGSTGYSTGPHLHYEVIVNGNKVNPMKIRLPKGRVLKGATLAAFKRERDRIDALIKRSRDPEAKVASL